MSRLNLTLHDDTAIALKKYAHKKGVELPAFVRGILELAVQQYQQQSWNRKLAHDYAAGRAETQSLLKDFSGAQLDLIGSDHAD